MAIICPYCFESVQPAARCPKCDEALPSQLKLSNLMFSIVGSTESGKSHYIAILIEQMKRQAARFGWSFHAANDETINLYDRRFKRPLYENLATIDKTQVGDRSASRPLIYSLCFSGAQTRRATLVFYDAAGERFNTQRELTRATRYLYHSSGVIFLVDPLQMPTARNLFLKQFPGEEKALPELATDNAKVGNIFTRMINAFQEGKVQEKISIPIAIALSKIDALRFLLTDEAPVFLPPFHRGGLSLSDFQRNSDYFRNLLTVIDEDREIASNATRFERVGYFGLSALGQNPQKTGRLQFKPRPIRPLDPLLWLLWQNGLIDGR